jgi:Ser/Thr protein kinase RdoA (MazF antagonist)
MSDLLDLLEDLLGARVTLEELKHKPGQRRTMRATGPSGTAIVKVYESDRAPLVAERLRAMAPGPDDPVIPEVLAVDAAARVVILSDVAGAPLRDALLADDAGQCRRVGVALARWHGAWRGHEPAPLRLHPIDRELEILEQRATRAPTAIRAAVRRLAPSIGTPWPCTTIVHRDLYEEQVLVDERVGLIDLDDAAIGPPELDLGNLWAHVDLLALRRRRDLGFLVAALLDAYGALDRELLARCRTLSRLRLACIHAEPRMLDLSPVG